MGVSEIRRLKQLEDENGKLKRLVADLTLDKTMVSQWNTSGPGDIGERLPCEKDGEARSSSRSRPSLSGGLRAFGT